MKHSENGCPFRALIFDVDGTLYRQNAVRRNVLWKLFRAHLSNPGQGARTLRVLQSYRKAHEYLRATSATTDLSNRQLRLAAEWTGYDPTFVALCVRRWMETEPLDLLPAAVYPHQVEFLKQAIRAGTKLAVFSDYPAEEKLAAMGLSEYFKVVVCAQDSLVQRLKPDPLGLEVTLRRLEINASEAAYIGDRADCDAVAALRAGMQCFIIGKQDKAHPSGWTEVSGYAQLAKILC